MSYPVANNMRNRLKTWKDETVGDFRNIGNMVMHRIEYGSPPVVDIANDAVLSARTTLDAKQARIQRRRQLLGMKYEPWNGEIGSK